MLQNQVVIGGEADLGLVIDGSAEIGLTADGSAEKILVVHDTEYYMGEYDFTPGEEIITVPIEQLTANRDITIQPIPDNYGRILWNGSVLTIY